jgi:hypothetical protein
MVAIKVREGGDVVVFNRSGRWQLPRDGAEVFGRNHPFFPEIVDDFIALIHHRNAGDLVLGGWVLGGIPGSFPNENGAHGGPGIEETRGFALIPASLASGEFTDLLAKPWLRGLDLRELAIRLLARGLPQMK